MSVSNFVLGQVNKREPLVSVHSQTGWQVLWFCFFNDTATTEIYTLSLHDALPIWVECGGASRGQSHYAAPPSPWTLVDKISEHDPRGDRKSTRLNSSHPSRSRMPSSACKKKNHTPIVPEKTCSPIFYIIKYSGVVNDAIAMNNSV